MKTCCAGQRELPVTKLVTPKVLISLQNRQTAVAITLAIGAVVVLAYGFEMLKLGVTSGREQTIFKFGPNVTITAESFGAVIMTTSLLVFLLAYRACPTLKLLGLRESEPDTKTTSNANRGAKRKVVESAASEHFEEITAGNKTMRKLLEVNDHDKQP